MYDTPGAIKASKSLRSRLLVTKAWNTIVETDHILFVVDSARRLSFEVSEAVKRLAKVTVDAEERMMIKAA